MLIMTIFLKKKINYKPIAWINFFFFQKRFLRVLILKYNKTQITWIKVIYIKTMIFTLFSN